jgi:hypothetical protein
MGGRARGGGSGRGKGRASAEPLSEHQQKAGV